MYGRTFHGPFVRALRHVGGLLSFVLAQQRRASRHPAIRSDSQLRGCIRRYLGEWNKPGAEGSASRR